MKTEGHKSASGRLKSRKLNGTTKVVKEIEIPSWEIKISASINRRTASLEPQTASRVTLDDEVKRLEPLGAKIIDEVKPGQKVRIHVSMSDDVVGESKNWLAFPFFRGVDGVITPATSYWHGSANHCEMLVPIQDVPRRGKPVEYGTCKEEDHSVRTDPTKNCMNIALLLGSGVLYVVQISAVVIDEELFILVKDTYNSPAYRDGDGSTILPELLSKYGSIPELDGHEVVQKFFWGHDLPEISEYKSPEPPNLSALADDELMVVWFSDSRLVGIGYNQDGEAVNLHFSEINGRACRTLIPREIVRCKIVPAHGRRQKWQAKGIIPIGEIPNNTRILSGKPAARALA